MSTVQANSGLLEDVENRSAEVAPYLTNLIALTTALKSRYDPTEVYRPVALRLLLISDLHDGNQYTIRQIQEPEDVLPPSLDLSLERIAVRMDFPAPPDPDGGTPMETLKHFKDMPSLSMKAQLRMDWP